MNASSFLSVFPRQLRFWTFHCIVNATPSFCIAGFILGLLNNPSAVAAMISAIGTFILLYSTLTALPGPLADGNHLLSRALHLGAKIRMVISVISLLLLPLRGLFLIPDFWCGYYSAILVDAGARQIGSRGRLIGSTEIAGFQEVFITTLLEGFILSILLLVISFFAVIVLQSKERRKFLRSARIHGESVR